MIKIPAKGLSERLRNAASVASLQGAWWTRWDLVHLAVEAAAQLESRDQRISQLEEAVDIVLDADAGWPRTPSSTGAWLSAIAILRHARG